MSGGNNTESGSGPCLGNSSIDTKFLDNSLIDSDDDTVKDKDLFVGGNNNGSGSGAFVGNFLINTTFFDNISIHLTTMIMGPDRLLQ